MDNGLLALQMLRNEDSPPLSMKSRYKAIPLCAPFLDLDQADIDSKEKTLGLIEETHFREQVLLQHEQFRREVWEPLKLFRGRNDNERPLSENILDAKELNLKKKELDKHILNAIRTCIMSD